MRRTLPISDHVDPRDVERSALEAELFGGTPPEPPKVERAPMESMLPRERELVRVPIAAADLDAELFGEAPALPTRTRVPTAPLPAVHPIVAG